MAGAVAAAKAMLIRLGMDDPAATEITGAQGLSQVEDFAELGEDEIKMLFSTLKHPGGLTAAGARNYGLQVNMVSQSNFAAMCFLTKHLTKRLDRSLTHADILLAAVRKAKAMQIQEKNHSDPTTIPVVDAKNWPKTMEMLETHIAGYRAQDGSRMNYMTRQDLFPPPAASDTSYGRAGSNYFSPDEEITARHRIVDLSAATSPLADHEKSGPFTEDYICDRGKVFDIITTVFASSPGALTIIKPFKKSRDGRGAYLALWNHYLGPNNVDHMAGSAEKVLASSTYKGQSSRYGIEQHIIIHKSAHTILEGLVDYGYTGIDERSKVRYLNDSIKTTKLDAPKAQIMASAELRSNFDNCATLYKDFVAQSNMNDHSNDRQISALSGNAPKGGYVPKEEWNAMSHEERAAELLARENRKNGSDGGYKKKGGNGGKGGGKANPHHKKKFSKIQVVAAKWTKAEQKVAKAAIKSMKDVSSDDEEEIKMKDNDGDTHSMRGKLSKKGQK